MNGELSFSCDEIDSKRGPIPKSFTREPTGDAYRKQCGWKCDPEFPRRFHSCENFPSDQLRQLMKKQLASRKVRGRE